MKWLLRTIRTVEPPLPATAAMITEAEQRCWNARNNLKKMLLLIRHIGPAQLIVSAEAVSDADRAVRRLWFGREPDEQKSHSVEIGETLRASWRALEEFTALARRLTTSSR